MKRGSEIEVQAFAFRLDAHSGVPVYRQLIDQVQAAIASSALAAGDQLPTVRQVAVDLAINPNTVSRAYREMEIRGLLDTQQGTGTFVADRKVEYSKDDRERLLGQLVGGAAVAFWFPVVAVGDSGGGQRLDSGDRRLYLSTHPDYLAGLGPGEAVSVEGFGVSDDRMS